LHLFIQGSKGTVGGVFSSGLVFGSLEIDGKLVELDIDLLLSVFLKIVFVFRFARLVSEVDKTFLALADDVTALLLKFYLINSVDLGACLSIVRGAKFSDDMSLSSSICVRRTKILLRLLGEGVAELASLIEDDLLNSVFIVLVASHLVHEISNYSLVDFNFGMCEEHIEELLQLSGSLLQKLRRSASKEFLTGEGRKVFSVSNVPLNCGYEAQHGGVSVKQVEADQKGSDHLDQVLCVPTLNRCLNELYLEDTNRMTQNRI